MMHIIIGCMLILSSQLKKLTLGEPFSFLVNFLDFMDFTSLMDFYNGKMMDSLKFLPNVVEMSKTVQIKFNRS